MGSTATAFAAPPDRAPIAQEVIDKLVPKRAALPIHPLPSMLRRHLERALKLIEGMETDPGDQQTKFMLLESKIHELVSLRPEIATMFVDLRPKALPAGTSRDLLAWDDLRTRTERRFDEVIALLNNLLANGTSRAARRARDELRAILRIVRGELPSSPIPTFTQGVPTTQEPDPNNAPPPLYMSSIDDAPVRYAFLGAAILAAVPPPTPSEAATCSFTAADLGQSQEVQITPEITALAESLSFSPVKIFKHVSNEINFEPYYGSLKGAMGTLYSKAGNATDQASLLIALLRASNIPARYVKGTARFENDPRVLNWVGAKSYTAAREILRVGKIPASGGLNDVQFTHVWVEACVPYGNYRGTAIDLTGHRWIPLDPSFKEKTYQSGIATDVSFDYTAYLAARSNDLPQEKYIEQITDYIKTQPPRFGNNTIEDVGYIGQIVPREIDVLPASLPYQVTAFNAWDTTLPVGQQSGEAAELPDRHRYKFNITVSKGSGTVLLPTLTLSFPEVVLQRITLSFKGATNSDQKNLDNWKNDPDPDASLSCTINVIPVIKADGVDKAVGTTSVSVCPTLTDPQPNRLNLNITLTDAGSTINNVDFTNIQAANYHALFGYAFQTSDRLLAERAARLLGSIRATPNPNSNQEETAGEFLHLIGLKYLRHLSDAAKLIGALDGGSGEVGNHLGLTSSMMKVEYLMDQPFAINRQGFLVDVPGGLSRNMDLTSGQSVRKTFWLTGHSASAYESYIWQENARLDAVSTVRGIQFASEEGIEILKVTSANWKDTTAPDPDRTPQKCKLTNNCLDAALNTNPETLLYSSQQVSDIETQRINQGFTVTLPRSLILYENWKGMVYSAESPTRASFIISGDYVAAAGGYSVFSPPWYSNYNSSFNLGFGGNYGLDFGWNYDIVSSFNLEIPPVTMNSAQGWGQVPQYSIMAGDPVNMVNGNVYHNERDISVKGRGLPLVFERSYNSREAKDGPLGFGWTHSFNHFLLFKDDNANSATDVADTDGITSAVSWFDGTGSEKFIQVNGTSSGVAIGATFTAPKGFFFQSTRNADGTYAIREKNGLTYTFESVDGTLDQKAKLLSIKDRNNNTLTLNYTGALLTSVTDALNRSLTFTYNGDNRITLICDWTKRCHQYEYDANGNLETYKNPLAVAGTQNPVRYTYFSDSTNTNIDHAMKSYTLPRGNGMLFEYYIHGKAFRHCQFDATIPAGCNGQSQTTTFTYNDFRRETASINERGHKRQFFFDKLGNPTKIVEERGGERFYTYDPANPMNRVSKRDPMGYVTRYEYDASGNVTRVTNPSGNTVEYFNFNSFNQPGKARDSRGNFTVLKYDVRGNLAQTIKLRSGIGAAVDPVTFVPQPEDVVSWTINTFDAFGNVLTSKQVKDFAAQTGPAVEYVYDAQNLNPTTIKRRAADGTIDATANLTHDSLGRMTAGVRPDFYPVQFNYDSVDRVTRGTDNVGNLRDNSFDHNGNPIRNSLTVSSVLLDQTTFTYDTSDRKSASANSAGFTTSYDYDAAGNVIEITDPDGRTLGFEYDPNNKVIAAFDQEGREVRKSLDLDGKPRTVTDPNGNTVSYEYYASERDGRLKVQRDALDRATTYDYDANGNVTSVTDNLGRTTLTTYDELNRPTRIVGPAYTDSTFGLIRPVTENTYDNLGRLVRVDAGRTDSTGANPASDVVATQMTYLYDDFGRKLRETDALGRHWDFQYDIHGNPIVVTDSRGQTTVMTYGYGHQLLSRVGDQSARGFELIPLSGSTRSWTTTETITTPPPNSSPLHRGGICVANGAGSCIGGDATPEAIVGPVIGHMKNTAEAGNVPVFRSTCYSNTAGSCIGFGLSLDVNGAPVGHLATTAPDAQSAANPFIQSNGLLLQGLTGTPSAFLWNATSTTIVTNHADHFYSTDGSSLSGYSAEGTTAFLRTSSGVGTVALKRYINSATGHHYYSTANDPPSGFTEEATLGHLDSAGGSGLTSLHRHFNATTSDYLLSTSSTPPSGYVLQATLGFLQNATNTNFVLYTRNALGQVTKTETPEVTYTYTYDAAHRLETVTDRRGGKALTYGYSDAGLLLFMDDSDGNQTDYEYDPVGRLAHIWAPNNDLISFVYDDGGRLREKWFPNGVNTQYSYNADNTLQQVINRHGSGNIISQHGYTYDGVGNRATHNETIAGVTTPNRYVYDELSWLREVRNNTTNALIESYNYDPLGNRIGKTAGATTLAYVYDAANQLTEIRNGSLAGATSAGLVYDLNGNLTKKCEGGTVTVSIGDCTGTTVTALTYDGFNRVSAVSKTGLAAQNYLYDHQGRRIQKDAGGTISNYLYNGSQILGQYDNAWTAPNFRFTYGPGADAPTTRANSTGSQYYHQNGIGNVVAVTNQTGTADGTASYDAWGNITVSTGTVPQFGYTGREPDETGVIFYRARYYDPAVGRFIQRDPIGFEGGLNLYAYVNNSPVNLTDPTGLWVGIDDIFFAVGGAAVGAAGQLVADALSGTFNLRNIGAAAVGGAVTAWTGLYTVPTMGPVGMVVAGAAGGAAYNGTGYLIDRYNTPSQQFDVGRFAFDTTVGAATGLIPGGSWLGVNAGRGSFNAIFNQMTTKAINGTISDITATTAAKMFAGFAVDKALLTGAALAGMGGEAYDKYLGTGFPSIGQQSLETFHYQGSGPLSGMNPGVGGQSLGTFQYQSGGPLSGGDFTYSRGGSNFNTRTK